MDAPYAGNALTFLVQVAFGLYILILMLRVMLAALRSADYYNPLTQFVVRIHRAGAGAPSPASCPRVGRDRGRRPSS